MNYKILYQNSENFRSYVDKYCKNYDISVNEALDHIIVKAVAETYKDDLRMIDDGK